jgi:hypothetical protein
MENPIEFINNAWLKNAPVTSRENQFAEYFPVVRILSFYPKLLKKMGIFSGLQPELPVWSSGCILYHILPKVSQVPRSKKYISAKQEEEKPEMVAIGKIFCVNKKHAKQLSIILKQQRISLGEKGK